jgi:bla regulator protein BlaR1
METLVQPLIKAFGWSIINSLWQSALIYGVLFLLLISLPKLAARFKHNLAFGSILLMFGCFVYNFSSHLLKNVSTKRDIISSGNLDAYQYFNNVPQSLSNKVEHYFPLIVTFYIIGIVLQMFVIGKGYNRLSKLKKTSLSNIPDGWKVIFENVTANLKINKTIKFHLSELVNVPLVIGYLKPVVLFPLALVNQLDNDQVEAILIHELSHIRRNDFLLNLIKTAIETFLFYNPFVWMAGRFIHIEREHACDDLVLKVTGKPLNYAHALLKLELLKDKTSPAYALAATGKTQNLYQRIKRITNMKTNYLNAKQQMAALTLGVACLFSIAWINPTEKKIELRKSLIQQTLKLDALSVKNPAIYLDTTKKHKIKIVTIDANGKKTEYNSIKEMPDSLRNDLYKDNFFGGRHAFLLKSDTAFKFRDSLFKTKIYRDFSSPEAQLKWKKFGEDIAKEYSSPEAQAKWKKFGENIAKEYSSPEAQAKWKKFAEDVAKEYNSPEAQAKWKKLGEDMAAKLNTPEFRAQISELRTQAFKNGEKIRISALSRINSDTAFILHNDNFRALKSRDGVYLIENSSSKLKQSEEYKKLKQKFDMEVKELKEKMEKQDKKEQPEHTEKSEQ